MKRTFNFCLMIFIITLGTLLQADDHGVRLGERPFIDIYQIPDETMEESKIWIKFQERLTGHLDDLEIVRDADGIVIFGIREVDELNSNYQVRSVRKLFDSPALTNEFEWRHRQWGFHLWYELHPAAKDDIRDIIMAYRSLEEAVSWAEPVYKTELVQQPGIEDTGFDEFFRWTPNDPQLGSQWHYNNTGQQNGTPGADISLFNAWNIEKGHSGIIVAIIDTGIDFNHADLAANMWSGIGYNFVDDEEAVIPGNHGTHVAGTVAAVTNNSTGVAGVAGGSGNGDGVRLMSCQIYTEVSPGEYVSGGHNLAMIYAADNGAAISQNSWSYTNENSYSQAVLDAIDYFNAHGGGNALNGGITLFAAGNRGESGQYYPGCYAGTFSVAGTNNQDRKAWYSTYDTWVDISAPGGETNTVSARGVLSTRINNNYGYAQGTSMACPHASGVAALLVSYAYRQGLTLDNSDVADLLRDTTDDHYGVNQEYIGMLGTGRLNAYAALTAMQTMFPGPMNPQDFEVVPLIPNRVAVSWQRNNDNDHVMLLWSPDGQFGEPVDGTVYFPGDTVQDNGTVLYRGGDTFFSHDDLTQGGIHHYKAFSCNSSHEYSFGRKTETSLLPFLENFNASSQLPYLWKIVDHQGNGNVWQFGTISGGLSGTTGNYAYLDTNSNSDLITPSLNLSLYSEVTVSFAHYHRRHWFSGSTATFSYSIDDGSTWTAVESWTATTGNPLLFNQVIPGAAGESKVKFKWNFSRGTWGYYWCVDDIEITGEEIVLATPLNLQAAAGNEAAFLTWNTPDEGSPEGYNIYRDGMKINQTLIQNTEFEEIGLPAGVTYEYYITAVYELGESGSSSPAEVTPYFLYPPLNLTAGVQEGTVVLEWEVPGSMRSGTELRSGERIELIGYNIYREGMMINPGTVTELQYQDSNVIHGVTYSYYVTAVYQEGESEASNTAAVTPYELPPVHGLTADAVSNYIHLDWQPPLSGSWIHWDNGENYTGIGNNEPLQFKAAIRFSPAELSDLSIDGNYLTKISFFPKAANAVYEINVWTGGTAAEPGTLVLEQPVPSPLINNWNIVELNTPVSIDTEQELWLGYSVATQTGLPAGCDSGPAVNGSGNMMFFNGEWTTLLALGSSLNYNWNIQGYVQNQVTRNQQRSQGNDLLGYRLYRAGETLNTELLTETEYFDYDIVSGVTYVYYVTAMYSAGESEPSNTAEAAALYLPEISLNTGQITGEFFAGENGYDLIVIGNEGAGDLIFNINISGNVAERIILPEDLSRDPGREEINWLLAIPSEGTVPAGDSLEIEVVFDLSDLPEGDYEAQLTINSNDPETPQLTIPVYLSALDPELAAPENITISLEEGWLTISWDEVMYADHYLIQQTDDISAGYPALEPGTGIFSVEGNRVSWTLEMSDEAPRLFFRVKAVRETNRSNDRRR